MGQWEQEGDSFSISLIGRLASVTNASLKGSDLTESRDGLRTCRKDQGDALSSHSLSWRRPNGGDRHSF